MSFINDISDIITSSISIYKTTNDIWSRSSYEKKRAWLTNVLDDAFSGKHYNPDKFILSQFRQVIPTIRGLEQVWLKDPWAYDLYNSKKSVWDENVKKNGNIALRRLVITYSIIMLVLILIIYSILKLKKIKK